MHLPIKILAVCLLLAQVATRMPAQVSITQNQMSYTQSFDGLPNSNTTWINNTTLPNWYAARTDYPGANAFPMRASDGSSSSTQLYSFRKTNPGTNRALGSIGSNGIQFAWGVRFSNDSGDTLRSVTVSWYMEQWRRTSSANEQALRFSYLVSGAPITGISANETGCAKVPFLNAISPVTTPGAHSSLDGDAPANRVLVRHTFRILVPPGAEIMLKWFDEDDSKIDHGLAVDDLEVEFFTTAPALDNCSGNVSLAHFMKGVILDIPDEDAGLDYIVPLPNQRNTWETAVQQILAGQYAQANATLATGDIGYRLSIFVAGSDTLYVAAKDGLSENYWGTYVFHPAAERSCLVLQAPHPLNDAMTGEQASYLFDELDAGLLMVAGAHRCLSLDPSGCSGSSTVCRQDGQYAISDLAHTVESVFQATTEIYADSDPNSRFVQLHGFSKSNNEPYFVISNGTRQTPAEDFVAELGDYLITVPVNSITPPPPGPFTYEAPHLNLNYNSNIGTKNIQGRFLNNYSNGDICTGNPTSTTVSGRFIHLEQYLDMRKNAANYPIMRDALLASGIADCSVQAGRTTTVEQPIHVQAPIHSLQVRYSDGTALAVLETPLQTARLLVLNPMGQVLSDQTIPVAGHAEVRLETATWPKGVYLLSAGFGPVRQTVRFVVR